MKYGAPRDTDHPELRQPLALEVWHSISRAMNLSEKITILTSGPLTNLANIILSDKNAHLFIQVSKFTHFVSIKIITRMFGYLN